ncbi:hypothetical protein [Gordonia sputi]
MHAFIDESKVRGLVVACTISDPALLASSRKAMQSMRANGQRRIHFTKESDPRRRKICSAICELGLSVRVYDTTSIRDQRQGRRSALDAVVRDLADAAASTLIIEQDDSLVDADRATLYAAVRRHQVPDLSYRHERPTQEPLLWVSDAVVWCYVKGGDWRRRVDPVIESVIQVSTPK